MALHCIGQAAFTPDIRAHDSAAVVGGKFLNSLDYRLGLFVRRFGLDDKERFIYSQQVSPPLFRNLRGSPGTGYA